MPLGLQLTRSFSLISETLSGRESLFATRGRVLVTLDADFANVMRFPPAQTLGKCKAEGPSAYEEGIRQAMQRAMLFLHDTDLAGRLAVVDDEKIRIHFKGQERPSLSVSLLKSSVNK